MAHIPRAGINDEDEVIVEIRNIAYRQEALQRSKALQYRSD
ncbi:hypothetical protein [Shinella zoogloeoides]|nr:hypothetical protein [Shinella zoogloeoides]